MPLSLPTAVKSDCVSMARSARADVDDDSFGVVNGDAADGGEDQAQTPATPVTNGRDGDDAERTRGAAAGSSTRGVEKVCGIVVTAQGASREIASRDEASEARAREEKRRGERERE